MFQLIFLTSCFPTKTLNVFHCSSTRPTSHTSRCLLTLSMGYILVISTYYKVFQYAVFSNYLLFVLLIDPNTFIGDRFSNILNVCSSVSVSDQVSHPYKRTRKCISKYCNLHVARWYTGSHNILNHILIRIWFKHVLHNLICFMSA